MKAKIEINGFQIQEAIEEYMTRRGYTCGPGNVRLSAMPSFDMMDHPTGGSVFSATVEIELGKVVAHGS
jgi:hypothetical protein